MENNLIKILHAIFLEFEVHANIQARDAELEGKGEAFLFNFRAMWVRTPIFSLGKLETACHRCQR